ncbi:MAG TPA: RDD family protein [Paenibacillaceae bacterium]|nr:RDD family protein [Paenibacillaceae bacterium]
MSTGANLERPAGFWIRFAAQLIDGIIVGIPTSIIYFAILVPAIVSTANSSYTTDGYVDPTPIIMSSFIVMLIIVVIQLLYFILIPALWNGFTPGKRIVGIRIAKVDGGKVGFGTMLLRCLIGGIADSIALSGLVSLILLLSRDDKRTLHDLIANTYVKYEK